MDILVISKAVGKTVYILSGIEQDGFFIRPYCIYVKCWFILDIIHFTSECLILFRTDCTVDSILIREILDL